MQNPLNALSTSIKHLRSLFFVWHFFAYDTNKILMLVGTALSHNLNKETISTIIVLKLNAYFHNGTFPKTTCIHSLHWSVPVMFAVIIIKRSYILLYNTEYILARPIWLFKLNTHPNILPYCTVKCIITYNHCFC